MKTIILTKGKFATVDDEDYNFLNQWKWHYQNAGYACRAEWIGIINGIEKSKCILMHRIILNTPSDKHTDHINGNRLDNRRCNLRICNRKENQRNQLKQKNTSSKYKGVYWDKTKNKWFAGIKINRKTKYLGRWKNEEQAAWAYNKAAKKYFGEFAKLNIMKRDSVKIVETA